MKTCYLHLGSNIGNRKEQLETAIVSIEKQIGRIKKRSYIYETEAWGNQDQNSFYNIAIKINTPLSALDILQEIHIIEGEMGRVRKEHWGPRTIDIDILFYKDKTINSKTLTVPHPLIEERRFVLRPMMDIAAHFTHPISKHQIRTLYKNCKDTSEVKKVNE